MAFVKCSTFKQSQEEQDLAIEALQQSTQTLAEQANKKDQEQDGRLTALETCCANNNTKNTAQDKEIEQLKKSISNTQGEIKNANDLAGNGLNASNEKLNVALSKDNGNLLSMRDDGLYYGTQAKANVANLYVDAIKGIDQDPNKVAGAGTKENPLRTLKYANSLAEIGTNRNIYLKEEQDHYVLGTERIYIESGALNIRTYGDKVDKLLSEYGDWNIVFWREINKENNVLARLIFTSPAEYKYESYERKFNYPNRRAIYVNSLATVEFYGVNVVDDISFNFDYEYENKAGVHTYSNTVNGSLFLDRQSSLKFIRCRFYSKGTPNVSGGNPSYKVENLLERDKNNLFKTCFLYSNEAQISIGWTQGIQTLNHYFFGTSGWEARYGRGVSISNIGGHDNNYLREVAKRIDQTQYDEIAGVKVILAPSTNISGTLF